MTKEQNIEQYYRTGLWCFKTGRRVDARLMIAAIRCFDPIHPLAVHLHALLGPRKDGALPPIAENFDRTGSVRA
jgi:hypothetical protein